jgi:tetratricopeptide (TPR) repeat protein
MAQGDQEAAEQAIQQAWQLYQQQEDVQGMGRALYRLGNIVYHTGDYERTVALVADAIRSQQEVGDTLGLLRSHRLATSAHLQLKAIEEAEHHCQAAAQLSEQLDDRAETSAFYYIYADLLRKKQDFPAAHSYAHKALALFHEMGDGNSEVNALLLLAGNEVNWNEAEPGRQLIEEGLAYCRTGLDICEAIGYKVGKAFLLLMNGRLLAQRGERPAARATWEQALELAQALQHQWLLQRLRQLIDEN